MRAFQIITDYKKLAMPIDMIARRNKVSLAYVINVLHYATVEYPQQIVECKAILADLEK